MKMRILVVLTLVAWALLLTLTACASLLPNVQAFKCPILVPYTQLEQNVLKSELSKDGPETQAQIEDYIKLRQACKA